MKYNWQQPDWPNFRYNTSGLDSQLFTYTQHAGRVSGLMEGMPEELSVEVILDLMITEAIQSSAIEGEELNRKEVMSSLRNRLGFNAVPDPVKSKRADGAGQLMIAVRESFANPLTAKTLHQWHQMLLDGTPELKVGAWRKDGDPMQVVSGRIDAPTVHFEAPPAKQVAHEMSEFIRWFNQTTPDTTKANEHPVIKSALAHLYFETIHPYEDGNGRIGRAISEKVLSQGLGRPVIMSLSRTIEARKNAYYDALKTAQRSTEVTPWVHWFVDTVVQSQLDTETQVRFVVKKSKFFRHYESEMNPRQLKVMRRIFEAGADGFTGGINARKYIALTGISKATATRDLQELAQLGILKPIGGGRSVRYELQVAPE